MLPLLPCVLLPPKSLQAVSAELLLIPLVNWPDFYLQQAAGLGCLQPLVAMASSADPEGRNWADECLAELATNADIKQQIEGLKN